MNLGEKCDMNIYMVSLSHLHVYPKFASVRCMFFFFFFFSYSTRITEKFRFI